jgi:hypothetical protein
MVATAAIYEINHWRKGQVKSIRSMQPEEMQRETYFHTLIQNFDNPFLDEFTLLSWVPSLFTGKRYKKKLHSIATECSQLAGNSQPEWKKWVEDMTVKSLNRSRSQPIELTGLQQLPKNSQIRDFLIKEFYHFLLKQRVEIPTLPQTSEQK